MINAGPGYQQVALSEFLGLYTEANPEDLPSGASPMCWDCDFNTGSVFMRPGKQSAFAFSGSSTGPNGCGLGTNQSVGGSAWANPNNITLHDGSYATCAITSLSSTEVAGDGNDDGGSVPWSNPSDVTGSTGYATATVSLPAVHGIVTNQTNVLEAIDFPFSIPLSATIVGIAVVCTAFYTLNSGSASSETLVAQLEKGGVPVGSAKSQALSSSSGTITFGSSLDLWGTSITAHDLDENNVKVALYASASSLFNTAGSVTFSLQNVQMQVWYTTSSDNLVADHFGFSLPNVPVNGIQIGVTGHQTASVPLTATLLKAGVPVGTPKTFTPTSSDTRIVLGSSTDTWGTTWSYSDLNATNFGVKIQCASDSATTFSLDYVDCTISQAAGSQNFNWFGSFLQDNGELQTLCLDSTGTLWKEEANTSPGILTSVYSGIAPNSYAKGVTQDDVEYIAISDLNAGNDIPRQWTGSALQRTSQVGPGAAPSVSFTSTTYSELASPNGITQPAATINSGSGVPIRAMLWSSGPGINHVAGNVITIYYNVGPGAADPNIRVGLGVVLAGFATVNGVNPNLTYIVTSVGTTPGSGGIYNTFTVTAPSTQYADVTPPISASFQPTLATVTTTAPVPNTQVGSSISLAGNTTAAWNKTWTVLFTPNASQLQITATSLTSDVATYDYTIITGSAPAVGELVTVTGTANGGGIFNVVSGIIASATGGSPSGSFTISITSPDIGSQAETGNGIINGTEFQFDPAPAVAGTATSAIYGNDGGGTIAIAGELGAGQRQAVCMFLTDEGFLTQCSPFVPFVLSAGANSITATNLPIGPPNVKARVVAFTGSGAGNYFYIPEPVSILSNGQNLTYSSTVVNDNVSTEATFTFTDAVLLAASAIDIQGSNNFEQKELGPSLGCIAYAARMFYWGELNKVTNFDNLSFDGGYLSNQQSTASYPLGWEVDPTNGKGGSLQVSPIFGNSYLIENSTGSTQAVLGLITQTAYQDQYNVNILNPQTTYSVRIAARTPNSSTVGHLVIDLYSPSFARTYGSASFPTSSMTSDMQLFSSTLLTTVFTASLPTDLQLRVWFSGSANGENVEIDRLDVFPTLKPVLTTQLTASYVNNFEAFDQVTGIVDASITNQQPIRSCFSLYGDLYIVKTNSFDKTTDISGQEPNKWQVTQVSNTVGTPSVYGVDAGTTDQGDDWAVIAGRAGVYIFDGGQPIPLSPEIRTLWNTINWKAGNSLWIKNDTVSRRILVGVPMPTPNKWLPNAPTNSNPTTPNVILSMSYVDVNGVSELADESVRVSAFTGKMLARDKTRKWTIWNIQSPYGDLIERNDGTAPMFLGNSSSTGKIYQCVPGLANDDGSAINELYTTYGFVGSEEGQEMQMGMVRKGYYMLQGLITGNGSMGITTYTNTLVGGYTNTLTPETLPAAVQDIEIPLNETGQRLFLQFSSNAVGEYFNISQLVMVMRSEPMAPVRGYN